MEAHEMFDLANRKMEELDKRYRDSGIERFSDYLRHDPTDRATMQDIARIRQEAHEQLSKELGE